MTANPNDPWVGMTAEDALRARAFVANQRAIQAKRQAAARALLAPVGPALEVKAAWAPLQAFLDEKDGGGGHAPHRR